MLPFAGFRRLFMLLCSQINAAPIFAYVDCIGRASAMKPVNALAFTMGGFRFVLAAEYALKSTS